MRILSFESPVLAVAATLVAGLCAGCTTLLDLSAEQCQTTQECLAKGDAFAGTVCTSEKICGREPCSDHTHCEDFMQASSYCRPSDSTCATLQHPSCMEVGPESDLDRDDDRVVVGFMGPLTGEFGSYGLPLKQGVQLALEEIETRANGFPGVGNGPRRHLSAVFCHDADDEEAVARFLVDEVQVPAIIGPAFSGYTIRVTTDVTTPANVLVISPSATSPDITGLDDNDLVWRTVPSDAIQAIPLALLIPQIETLLTPDVLAEGELATLVMTVKSDSWGSGLAGALEQEMRNLGVIAPPGSSAPSNPFTRINYSDPANQEAPANNYGYLAQQIAALEPHIVLGVGTNEFVQDLLPAIEQAWNASLAWRPRYLLSEGARVDELKTTVGGSDLGTRILGTAPGARQSELYASFASAFAPEFGEPGNLAEFAYDAAYLAVYAIGLANQQAPTGREMANALTRTACPEGSIIPAGVANFSSHFATAASSPCINFEGVSGPLDFNLETGEAPGDMAVWCPQRDGDTVRFQSLPTYYSVATGTLVGEPIAFCGP